MPDEGGGLILVHAHPDDEAFGTGGLIARTVAEGRRVDLVICTGGEEGEIHDPTLDHDEAMPRLQQIREAELRCSVAALHGDGPGELHLHMLGYRDSGMMGTPSNDRDDVFWHADLAEAARKVGEIIREARPAAMVSYDSNGNYGHPDHINAHRVAVAAWEAADEALAKLYETAFNRDRWTRLTAEMKARGIKLPWNQDEEPESVEEEELGLAEADMTTTVDVAAHAPRKHAAMDCHKTQRQDLGWLLDLPADLKAMASSPEYFVLKRWRGREIPAGYRETSLFDGL